MNNPLLNIKELEFRPYTKEMEGWFVWRCLNWMADPPSRLIQIVKISNGRQWGSGLSASQQGKDVDPDDGEFAGPVI